MNIKSVSAPAIGEEGLKRLRAFTQPKRMTSTSTLFDAGYEQAKRDFAEKLAAETGRPTDNDFDKTSPYPEPDPALVRAELAARRAFAKAARRPWWLPY